MDIMKKRQDDIEIKRPKEFLEVFEKAYQDGKGIFYKDKPIMNTVMGITFVNIDYLAEKLSQKDWNRLRKLLKEIWEFQEEDLESRAHLNPEEMGQ